VYYSFGAGTLRLETVLHLKTWGSIHLWQRFLWNFWVNFRVCGIFSVCRSSRLPCSNLAGASWGNLLIRCPVVRYRRICYRIFWLVRSSASCNSTVWSYFPSSTAWQRWVCVGKYPWSWSLPYGSRCTYSSKCLLRWLSLRFLPTLPKARLGARWWRWLSYRRRWRFVAIGGTWRCWPLWRCVALPPATFSPDRQCTRPQSFPLPLTASSIAKNTPCSSPRWSPWKIRKLRKEPDLAYRWRERGKDFLRWRRCRDVVLLQNYCPLVQP